LKAGLKEKTLQKRISLMVITALVVTGACAVLFTYSCGKGEDPAQAMLDAQKASTPAAKSSSTPAAAPAEKDKAAAPTPPATGEKPATSAGGPKAAGATTGEGPKTGDASTAKPDDTATKPDAEASADKKETGKDSASEDKPADAKAKGDKKKKGGGDISEDERIVNFQNLDPRDIIIQKYDNLAELHTEPWNAEKSEEDFIPETGRIDPLNPVDSAIPDELKPPRSGETDQNLIETYLVSMACTSAVDSIRQQVQVYNVLKIGAQKYVSIGIGGQRGSIEVGQSFGFMAGVVGNIAIMVTLTVSSATESEVVIDVTASGEGTATSVSKSQVFIPGGFKG
jgi:hypothetical protein